MNEGKAFENITSPFWIEARKWRVVWGRDGWLFSKSCKLPGKSSLNIHKRWKFLLPWFCLGEIERIYNHCSASCGAFSDIWLYSARNYDEEKNVFVRVYFWIAEKYTLGILCIREPTQTHSTWVHNVLKVIHSNFGLYRFWKNR